MNRMAVLVLAALAACHAESAVAPKEIPMPTKTVLPAAAVALPPLDLDAPAKVETATFALG